MPIHIVDLTYSPIRYQLRGPDRPERPDVRVPPRRLPKPANNGSPTTVIPRSAADPFERRLGADCSGGCRRALRYRIVRIGQPRLGCARIPARRVNMTVSTSAAAWSGSERAAMMRMALQ